MTFYSFFYTIVKTEERYVNEFFLTRRDGFQISVLYSPIDHPKALVQLVHGAWEHKERYKRLIQLLNENGYSVIIHVLLQ